MDPFGTTFREHLRTTSSGPFRAHLSGPPSNYPNYPSSIPIRSQLDANSIPIRTQFDPSSIPVRFQLDPNSVPTRSKLDPNSIPTGEQATGERAPVCSETLISARVPASPEPGIVFAADVCSVAKFRSPFRSGKASFSLQTGAPSRNSEANGCRRRAKVAKRCGGVNWGPRALAPLGTPPGTSNSPPDFVFNFCSTSGPVCSGISATSTGLQRKRCFSGANRGPESGS